MGRALFQLWSSEARQKKTRGDSLRFSIPLEKMTWTVFQVLLTWSEVEEVGIAKILPILSQGQPFFECATFPAAPPVCFATCTDCGEDNSGLTIGVCSRVAPEH